MPPKAKYTRQEIIDAAFDMTREKGIDSVTARELGAYLNVSARPIFTYFSSMDELKSEIVEKAREYYCNYVIKGTEQPIPFLGVGMYSLRFAMEETRLYELLFLYNGASKPLIGNVPVFKGFEDLYEKVICKSIMEFYRLSRKAADRLFTHMCIFGHGIAALCVGGICEYSPEDVAELFAEECAAMLKAMKEIPGMEDGGFDKDKVFSELIAK